MNDQTKTQTAPVSSEKTQAPVDAGGNGDGTVRVTGVRIENVRNIELVDLNFPHGEIEISGENEAGKTAIFDGIRLAMETFDKGLAKDIVRHGAEQAQIDVRLGRFVQGVETERFIAKRFFNAETGRTTIKVNVKTKDKEKEVPGGSAKWLGELMGHAWLDVSTFRLMTGAQRREKFFEIHPAGPEIKRLLAEAEDIADRRRDANREKIQAEAAVAKLYSEDVTAVTEPIVVADIIAERKALAEREAAQRARIESVRSEERGAEQAARDAANQLREMTNRANRLTAVIDKKAADIDQAKEASTADREIAARLHQAENLVAERQKALEEAQRLLEEAKSARDSVKSAQLRVDAADSHTLALTDELSAAKAELYRIQIDFAQAEQHARVAADTLEGAKQAVKRVAETAETFDFDALDKKLAEAEDHNAKYRRYEDYTRAQADAETKRQAWERFQQHYKDLQKRINDLLAGPGLPVPGMTFADDDVMVDGCLYETQSRARRDYISAQLVMAMNPRVKTLFVSEASLWTERMRARLREEAAKRGIENILYEISGEKPGTIIIREGRVAAVPSN